MRQSQVDTKQKKFSLKIFLTHVCIFVAMLSSWGIFEHLWMYTDAFIHASRDLDSLYTVERFVKLLFTCFLTEWKRDLERDKTKMENRKHWTRHRKDKV